MTLGRAYVRYYTTDVAARQRAAAVRTPFAAGSAAAALAAVIAAQAPDWTFSCAGYAWTVTDPDGEYHGRRVVVDASPGLTTDPFHPDRPRPWRPGCMVAAYAARRETLIQLPHLADSGDIIAVVHALIALDALPPAPTPVGARA